MRARVPGPVNFYIEYMEATRAEDENYQRNLTASLRDTYRGRKLDLVMLSGYPSLELLKRMDEQGRIIAIDTSSPLLDEARTKAGKLSGKRIFFRSESSLPKLPFAEQVYDQSLAAARSSTATVAAVSRTCSGWARTGSRR